MRTILNYKLNWVDVASLVSFLVMCLGLYAGYRAGLFDSRDNLVAYVNSFGFFSVVLFISIQFIQVVLPFLPSAIICTAGIILFGPGWGLLYNYIGICLGSIAAFFISRRYGKPIVKRIIGKRAFDKYSIWINKGKAFDRFFTISIAAPIAPDDILCYLAGMTSMSLKRFIWVILLGKPLPTALYSLGATAVFNWLNIF